ncbi:MAG TPA: crotonase, partial [Pseudomonas sp.]|nr:crotonase [Pseudomonas sp.]
DIMEGVRALIIDKDRQPRWTPATLDEIDPNWVDGFFSPQATHKNAARTAKA